MTKFLTGFTAKVHGFHFGNSFDNKIINIPNLVSWTTHGRCGGMAFASLDYYYAGLPVPTHVASDFPNGKTPDDSSVLAQYIWNRLLDSFSWNNAKTFVEWTLKLDHSTWVWGEGVPRLTKEQEFPKLRERLKNGPVALGLVGARDLFQVGDKNHQVVAYGYEVDDATGKITIYIYDNNNPDEETTLTSESSEKFFYSSFNNTEWRGFFVEDYAFKYPTYLDLGVVKGVTPSTLWPRLKDPLECTFTVKNFGQYPAHVSSLNVSVLGPVGENLDLYLGRDNKSTPIQPGEERVYKKLCSEFGTALGKYVLNASYISGNNVSIDFLPTVTETPAGRSLARTKEVTLDVHLYSDSILNIPPYVESVSVVRTLPGRPPITPTAAPCELPLVLYSASWTYNPITGKRVLNIYSKPIKPSSCHEFYVYIKFSGPNAMKNSAVKLKLTGQTPDSKPFSSSIALTGGGVDYAGKLVPSNTWNKNYTLRLEIQGADAASHYKSRSPLGDVIDAKPETAAAVDFSKPPQYPFKDYEPGVDLNHAIEVGTRTLNLPPDAYETNNDFASAKTMALDLPDPVKGSNLTLEKLNLQSATDEDYFKVTYQGRGSDDACGLKKPKVEPVRLLFGAAHMTHYPPVLWGSVWAEDSNCVDLDLYQSDKYQRQLYQSLPKSHYFRIENPGDKLHGEKQLYLRIKNASYTCQGAFPYDLSVGYMPEHYEFSYTGDELTIPETAGVTDVARKFLKRLYDALDLPRPPEDLVSRGLPYSTPATIVTDMAAFIKKYEGLLLQTQTAKELTAITKTDAKTVVANEIYNLGKVSQSAGFLNDSERLYQESSKAFAEIGNVRKQATVLSSLSKLYAARGMTTKAAEVMTNVRKILTPR